MQIAIAQKIESPECDADDRDIVDGQFCVICQEEEDEANSSRR